MLGEACRDRDTRALANVGFCRADVHRLPFPDGCFDAVTCRRAAHHFARVLPALREMRRVLKAGGRLIVDDRSVPDDDFVDATMNRLDRWHDESHVRQYRPAQWKRMLEKAGFAVELIEPYTKHRPLSSLTEGVSDEDVARIRETLAAMSAEERGKFALEEQGGESHLTHWYLIAVGVQQH